MKTEKCMADLTTKLALALMLGASCISVAVAESGRVPDDSSVNEVPVGPNTEQESASDLPGAGYAISVDGEVIHGSQKLADRQRKTDLGLEAVDIQVKFDGLDSKPALNVTTVPIRRAYTAGEEVDFLASLNYHAWITRAEVRIHADDGLGGRPLTVVDVADNGTASWQMPSSGPKTMYYVLRVYDADGRYDETIPLPLVRSSEDLSLHEPQDAIAPGYGDDRTAFRNIPVYGGIVTVHGSNVPGSDTVIVMGERVPVDAEGKFVVQRILPPGDHKVSVAIRSENNKGLQFSRDINIPANDWFYVALADLTAGYRFGDADIEDVKAGSFDKTYTKGRLAFYLKGKIQGRTLLTAAADTGEGKLKDIFKGLDAKDPRQFLRRIDPDDYYPVYGDDSTTVEDAPTRGKFYVRLERGDSHVMWGNFKTHIIGTELLRNERALYGASGVYRSQKQAEDGGRATELSAYVAQPGTLPQRDVLRGTGGSAYFLKHQDITIGSETVNVEVRNKVSGRLLDRRQLRYGVDYDIDYVQGVILLRRPLPSSTDADGPVRDGALGGNPVSLVVAYEFTPSAGEVDGYVYGGRAQQWIGDHVRVGITGQQEKTGTADQKLYGADLRLSTAPETYIEGEYAHSRGPGFGKSVSSDGGLTIDDVGTAGKRGRSAEAYRAELKINLAEVTDDAAKGSIGAHYQHFDKGFSSLNDQVEHRKENWGASAAIELGDRGSASLAYNEQRVADGKRDLELAAGVEFEVTDHITFAPGVTVSQREDGAAGSRNNGSRTDVGAKLTYTQREDRAAYVFGQATVDRSGDRRRNNRVGLGGETMLTEKVSASGEVSYGTRGIGGMAELGYAPTADDHYYIGYRLEPDRQDNFDRSRNLFGEDLGTIVGGVKHRFSEEVSIYAEDSYDLFGDRRTLTQAYGVEYTPNAVWSFNGAGEWGFIEDTSVNETTGLKNSDFDRKAISLSAGYKTENGNAGGVKGEVRLEDSDDDTRDMTSYLLSANVGLKANDDWRFLANLDAVFSDATATTRDGRYLEGALGYAYRPVDNDRLNALFKYTFLYDYPGADQVTVNGTTRGDAQRSHIFSADANYDITPYLTLGAKYGFRIGETKPRDGSGTWEEASAHLGIVRADINVVKDWDALVEGRILWVPEADGYDLGALAAVYRHVGDNFKIGVGYNFGQFSDDLRDLTYDDHGVFVNVIGQF